MNLCEFFIRRPVATTLLSCGLAVLGCIAFRLLPVAPLPQVELPTISVQASLPGASPETMASTIATPLERHLGRISGLSEMTSSNSMGSTRIIMQFDLSKNIDDAARDVQAAINAARSLLPANLPRNPSYYKVNPADAPIMILSLTSAQLGQGEMYDYASNVLVQKLSQIEGVGQVTIGGSSLPAIRINLNRDALEHLGISTAKVREAINNNNVNLPKGYIDVDNVRWQIASNSTLYRASDYQSLVVAEQNGSVVKLSDVATVEESVQDLKNAGSSNGQSSVLLMVFKQPDSNIIKTVENVRDSLLDIQEILPASLEIDVMMDRTSTIRASLHEAELTLIISILLVITAVVFFLKDMYASLIPIVIVPISILGTFCLMYLWGFSLNNLSIMALIVACGFVVDDAIVVLENCKRHMEQGLSALTSALVGVREVSFTVLSMSLSLGAVFIPILFMDGVIGRFFREFSLTVIGAIAVSLVLSLSTTPMMCAHVLSLSAKRAPDHDEPNASKLLDFYGRTLGWALKKRWFIMLLFMLTIAINIFLYWVVPKGAFPQQDTGRIGGTLQADQSISFEAMKEKMDHVVSIVRSDPDVENVVAYIGGSMANSSSFFITLKPQKERELKADDIIERLKKEVGNIAGSRLFLQSAQDMKIGSRQSNAAYQYSITADSLELLQEWTPRLALAFSKMPELTDVTTNQQLKGIQARIHYNRDSLSDFSLSPSYVNSALNDIFGQRLIGKMYSDLNIYHLVLDADKHHKSDVDGLFNTKIITDAGNQIPLNNFSTIEVSNTSLAIGHQGQQPSATISFNIKPGFSFDTIIEKIQQTIERLNAPTSIQGDFQGSAKVFKQSLDKQPFLIGLALVIIYIVLGMLYESYIHPLVILSTIPSAGIGALLLMLATGDEFSIISFIGVILLVGIVMKNAIIMVDFSLATMREYEISAHEAVYQACMLRMRPIMMTTFTALLAAVPLALGFGEGAEIRQPLGICIIGGLIMSQMMTLYTTPVIFLMLDNLAARVKR